MPAAARLRWAGRPALLRGFRSPRGEGRGDAHAVAIAVADAP
jgi:hypothetical protein